MSENWNAAAYRLAQQGKAYVIATIIGVSGSTPRDSGSKMIISEEQIFDTLGGGHLEHKIIKFARHLLLKNNTCQHLEHFQLGIHLDQCCGGSTNVLFECFSGNQINIMLFGAGNVGQALIPILASLPCQIFWVDGRAKQFPETSHFFDNVVRIVNSNPQTEVKEMPANSYYIVMTHKHQLDFDICHEVFKRNDYDYLGLIGSQTKKLRFQQRFKQREISDIQIQSMQCPIGLSNVKGKLPAEIAVSVAAEIIEQYQNTDHELHPGKSGVHWKMLDSLSNQKMSLRGVSSQPLSQNDNLTKIADLKNIQLVIVD